MMRAFHPLADIFPLIEGAEFDQLVESIKASDGPRESVVVYEDMILDGRNRARACEAIGIEPPYTPFKGDDPVAFVIDKNLRRRHLNESQRGMAAAKLATMPHGGAEYRTANLQIDGTTRAEAAKMLNVSERTVNSAAKVRDHAEAAVISAVEQGHLAVSAAAQATDLSGDDQREIAKEARAGRKKIARLTIKEKRRQRREQKLARPQRRVRQWEESKQRNKQLVDDAADTLLNTLGAEGVALVIKSFSNAPMSDLLYALREKIGVAEHSFGDREQHATCAVAQ
jgi:hypothetical protein